MLKQYTSTKTFLGIPLPRLGQGSKGKSVPTAFDLQPVVREHQHWAVKEVTAVATVEIYPLLVSRQSLRPQALVQKMSFVAQPPWPWLEIHLIEGT